MESKLHLKPQLTIQDFQQYVKELKVERGFSTDDKSFECMLMAEEMGELFSAIRKNMKGGSIGSGSTAGNVKPELADVFILHCPIANQHNIDIEVTLREKEE